MNSTPRFSRKAAIAAAFFFAALLPLSLAACRTSSTETATDDPVVVDGGDMSVYFATAKQTIDGFGGSNAWASNPSDSAIVRKLFSRTDGIGLSILRNRIPFREYHYVNATTTYDDAFINRSNKSYIYTEASGVKTFSLNWTCWELGKLKTLIATIKGLSGAPEDLVIMSTPWTPPNNSTTNWKTGVADAANAPDVGGTLDPNHYADYADLLADYANGFQTKMGEPLDALSVQNEPDWEPDYEACSWTSANICDFLKVMKARFALKSVSSSLNIIAAEGYAFRENLVSSSLSDADARGFLDIVGVHQYYDASTSFSLTANYGKKLWMTEVSSGKANDSSISDGLYWAKLVHKDLAEINVNAFLYWWLWWSSSNPTKSCLVSIDSGTGDITYNKRLYTLGQFSRYIRPGWVRVDSTTSPSSSIYTSAYRNPSTTDFAIVLINDGSSPASVSIGLSGATGVASLSATRTSATEDMAPVTAPAFSSSSSSLSVTLAANSVTTLYGSFSQ